MKADHILLTKMRARLTRHGVREGARVLVGFSGGADSVSLLHALATLLGADRVEAIHINHMLRGEESERDERFCRAFCEKHGISFSAHRVDIPTLSGGTAIEETARNARYALYETVAETERCPFIALAHHAGDNLETMLFCLCRGAGLAGMSGIPPVRPLGTRTVIRPLIDCTREEILSYLRENALPHITDSSNTDEQYTRNFIRSQVIPALLRVNPRAEENAVHTAEAASLAAAHLISDARVLLAPYPRAEAPLAVLRPLDGALLYTVLNELYRDAGGTTLPRAQSEAIVSLLKEEKKGHAVDLTGGISARIDGDTLRLQYRATSAPTLQAASHLYRGRNEPTHGILVFVGETPPDALVARAHFTATAYIPERSLDTLLLRPRENGEHYRLRGMTRSLKKLLSGRSVREKSRPLLCDGEGILWHPSLPPADRAASTGGVPVVYLEYEQQ
ncbi:MAG: tRNA lysidine(34) synthetase TilS [Clostridia bacterium]|nr:tRNA lysidine(34) synthetase TilS [Clostridia bacterium]